MCVCVCVSACVWWMDGGGVDGGGVERCHCYQFQHPYEDKPGTPPPPPPKKKKIIIIIIIIKKN